MSISVHYILPVIDTKVDSNSLLHHGRKVEIILNKLSDAICQLIHLRSSNKYDSDQTGIVNLQRTISENLQYVISVFEKLQQENGARERKLNKIRDEFRCLVNQFERVSNYCFNKLPATVQKEHETVTATLVKQRWNISEHEEECSRAATRVHTLEAFNHKLEGDIRRLGGCTLLANEKSSIEEAEMERIAQETEEATKSLELASDQLHEAELRHEFAINRAKKVRQELAVELAQTESSRESAKRRLSNALGTEPRLISETKSLTKRTEVEENRKTKEQAELEEHVKEVSDGIQSVSRLMQEQDAKKKLLDSVNCWLNVHQKQLDTKFDGKLEQEQQELLAQHRKMADQVDSLRLEKLDMQMKLEMYTEQQTKCEKSIEKTKQEFDRLRKRQLESSTELVQANNRLKRARFEHEKIRHQLQTCKKATQTAQERLRRQIDEMQERIKHEAATRASLLAAIEREIEELEQGRMEALAERKDVQERVDRLEKLVQTLEQQAESLRVERDRCISLVKQIGTKYQSLQAKQKEQRSQLESKVDVLEHQLEEKRQKSSQLQERLQQMITHKEQLVKEKQVVRKNIEAMFKVAVNTQHSLSQVKFTIAELEAAQRAHQSQLDAINEQMSLLDMRHQERMAQYHIVSQSRQAALTEFKRQLTEALHENSRLAESYQTNQREQKQLVHAFHVAFNELSRSQWEMCDAEQLVALHARTTRQMSVHERRFRAGPLLVLLQLEQHWNAVSCRLRVIEKHSQQQLAITETADEPMA